MAINKSKLYSPQAWFKWFRAGSIPGVRCHKDENDNLTVRFDRPVSTADVIAFMMKCNLRPWTRQGAPRVRFHTDAPDESRMNPDANVFNSHTGIDTGIDWPEDFQHLT